MAFKPTAHEEPADARLWIKDIDISSTVENTLIGILLFAARFGVTFWTFLAWPERLPNQLLFSGDLKLYGRIDYVRPLTYLAVAGFLFVAFASAGIGDPIPISPIMEGLEWWIAVVPTDPADLNFSGILSFMVPFILFVGLFALSLHVCFSATRIPIPFKVHLNLASYATGCFALVFSLGNLVEERLWEWLRHGGQWPAVALVIFAIAFLAATMLIVFRYLALLRTATGAGWVRVLFTSITGYVLFLALTVTVLALLDPWLERMAQSILDRSE